MKQNARFQSRPGYLRALRDSPLGRRLDLGTLELLSERAEACPLQDPFRIRARYLGWKAASILIDEDGELNRSVLDKLLKELTLTPYPLGYESDTWLYTHLARSLKALSTDEGLRRLLKKCSLPLCNKTAEEVIRQTIWPDEPTVLKTAHVRRAVLAAWLTMLRQATGSCFATAPAMLIQREDPSWMLQDLDLLLSAGEIRRGGASVPMNPGAGVGELHKPLGFMTAPFSPGLRAAFFSSGLPLSRIPFEGATAQAVIDQALFDHFELSAAELEQEKSSLAPQMGVLWERAGGHFAPISERAKKIREWEIARKRAMRGFLATADCALLRCWEYTVASFSDVKVEFARWNLYVSLGIHSEHNPPGIGRFLLKVVQHKLDQINQRVQQIQFEHQQAIGLIHATESMLQRSSSDAHRHQLKGELMGAVLAAKTSSELLNENVSLSEWISKFYPEMIEHMIERLQHYFQEVFEPSLLSKGDEAQFEDSAAGFRLIFKHGRASAASWERIESAKQFTEALYRFIESIEYEISVPEKRREDLSAIITELLQYVRTEEFLEGAMQRAKENRSHNQATPWTYSSGGTMQTLVQYYFGLSSLPQQFTRNIHSEQELLSWLKESAKHLRHDRPSLMLSYNHAFLLYPNWIQAEHVLERNARFLKTLSLTVDQAEFLQERFSKRISEEKRPLFFYGCRQSPLTETISSLRQSILQGILAVKNIPEEAVDGFLYESLPLFSYEEAIKAKMRLFEMLSHRFGLNPFNSMIQQEHGSLFTPLDLLESIKATLLSSLGKVFFSIDWEQEILAAARKELFLYPHPVLFGDTNWSDWCFGFIQNVATGELELWRLSRTAQRGLPMRDWKSFFRSGEPWTIVP